MATQVSTQNVRTQLKENGLFGNGLFLATAALALIVVVVLTARLAVLTSAAAAAQRVNSAETARWTGLAENYAQHVAQRQRAVDAESARWSGLADVFTHRSALNAEAARYTAMAIQAYVQTGDPALLPTCVSASVMGLLPHMGDDTWKEHAQVCAE